MSKQDKKKAINPLVAGVTGAIVGGVAAATAITLSNEKNREKIKDAFSGAKDKAMGYVEDLRDKKDEMQEKFANGAERVKETAKDIKESVRSTVEDIKDSV